VAAIKILFIFKFQLLLQYQGLAERSDKVAINQSIRIFNVAKTAIAITKSTDCK